MTRAFIRRLVDGALAPVLNAD